jgi:predicted Fe-Mo cluster-binding NifX family protein
LLREREKNMKIMITTCGDFVSPRFDLSTEVIIATYYDQQLMEEPRSLIFSKVSAEILCELALKENVAIVVCGGIEEQHYQFLTWKKISVIDAVIGPYADVLQLVVDKELMPGTILPGVTSREVAS